MSKESEFSQTQRPVSEFLEGHLFNPIPVLDHGSVCLLDYMGDDQSIVQAARASYGKGTKAIQNSTGLIAYLMRHRHTTPFEMLEIKFHIKAPIFVARQWLRHRTASVNEYSARYSIMEKEFYIPQPEALAKQSTTNKQGREEILDPDAASRVLEILMHDTARCYDHYEEMIDSGPSGCNLSRELARMNLPVSVYTQFIWKINLHNLLHFISLRADSHAQMEIRVFAEVIDSLIQGWVPAAHAAFKEYRTDSFTLSGTMLACLRESLQTGVDLQECCNNSRLSAREKREFLSAVGYNS